MDLKTKVEKVVVYRTGAFITRGAVIHLGKGKHRLCLDGIPNSLVKETIQLTMTEGMFCNQVKYDEKYALQRDETETDTDTEADTPEEIKTLIEQKKISENQLSVIRFAYDVLSKKIDLQNKDDFQVCDLKEYIEYIVPRQNELLEQRRVLTNEQVEIAKKLDIWKKEQEKNKKQEKKVPATVILDVEVHEEAEYKIELMYYDYNAKWMPFYDIRIDQPDRPLCVILKGKISQSTKEDWKDIDLSVSTGNIGRSNNQPELKPWMLMERYGCSSGETTILQDTTLLLQPVQRQETESPLRRNGVGAGSGWRANPENREEKNQTSTVYHIAGKCSVEADDEGSMIEISRSPLEAEYIYHMTPKAECSAFLMAHINGWQEFGFLDCDANIFLENKYVGVTHINPMQIDDDLKISLGRDYSISIQREKTKQYRAQKLIGSQQYKDFEYQIKIKNGKNNPIKAVVNDQIPVSTTSKIQVDVYNVSNAILNPNDGSLVWKYILSPMEELKLDISFRISWSKDANFDI